MSSYIEYLFEKSTNKLAFDFQFNLIIVIYIYCVDCLKLDKIMSSMVPGAFAARKIHELSKMPSKEQELSVYSDNALTELSPLKYNSKLMNSIWGLYNRYSVHNIKQNTNDNSTGNQQKETSVYAKDKETTNITILTKAFNNILPNVNMNSHI